MALLENGIDSRLAGIDAGDARADVGMRRGRRAGARLVAVFAVSVAVAGLAACGNGSDGKTYDIAPIFPLSSGKCAQYDGTSEGSGLTSHCWVTKSECEQAAADWKTAMQNSYVSDPIEFTC
jgi:hypothetical protein